MTTKSIWNRLHIGFQHLTNAALGDLAYETMGIANKLANATINGNPIYRKIPAIYAAYSALLGKNDTDGMGEIVYAADRKRDVYTRAFVSNIRNWAKFSSQDLPAAKAAQELLPVVNILKRISQKTYAQETQILQSFVQEMNKTANRNRLKELGLFTMWEVLLVVINDFVEKHENEMMALAAKKRIGYATTERKKLEEILAEFYSFVNLYKKEAPWSTLFEDLIELQKHTKW